MEVKAVPYERIIFVCCNQRKNGEECCNKLGGSEIRDRLKRITKEYNLNKRIRIAGCGCLGKCNAGVNIMIFPDNVWLKDVTENNISEIVLQYIEPLR
ncbi:MAG: (2Fe-2S) ferredoxin domain-containing protein [Candidatus Anammoxibacter sp.]